MQPIEPHSSIPSIKPQGSLQPLQERAIVTKIEGDYAWVSVVDKSSGCETCSSKGACGSFNLFKPLVDEKLANNNNNLKIRNTLHLVVGEALVIEMSPQSLLTSTFLLYLLPLFMLFIGAVIGRQIGGELTSTILGMLGLIVGLFLVKSILSKTSFKERLEPTMVSSV